jgi:hypothetical protein
MLISYGNVRKARTTFCLVRGKNKAIRPSKDLKRVNTKTKALNYVLDGYVHRPRWRRYRMYDTKA